MTRHISQVVLGMILLGMIYSSPAQEPLRYSLAGETMASAQKNDFSNEKYNFKVGPVLIRMAAGGTVEFNDNIGLAPHGRQADVILRPQVNFDGIWHVTDLNTLLLTLGIEYDKYLTHSQFDSRYPIVTPNSSLAFNMYVSDFRINFHDTFAYQEDPLTQAQIANTARYGRFTNSLGTTVDWDLNDVVLTFGYDYGLFLSSTSEFSYLDSDSNTVNAKATFTVDPTTKAGLQINAVQTSFRQRVENNSVIVTTGPFIDAQVTEYISVSASMGLQVGDFDNRGSIGDNHDLTDFYGGVTLNHRLNQWVTQSVAFGRNSTLGVASNFSTIDYIRHNAYLNLVKDVTLGTELFLEHGNDSGGPLNETFTRYGAGLMIGYRLTSQLDMGAHYRFTLRDSNAALRDYYQDSLGINFHYQF